MRENDCFSTCGKRLPASNRQSSADSWSALAHSHSSDCGRMRLRDGGRRMAREWYAKSLVLAVLSAAKRADLPRLIGQDRCPGNWTFACQKRRQRSKMNLRAYQRGAAMDETIVGV